MGVRETIKNILRPLGMLWLIKNIRSIKIPNQFLAFKFYFYNSFLTHFPNYKIRTFYLRRILNIKIGKKTAIHMGCFFAGSHIIIGNNNVIGRNCYLDGRDALIEIKNNVSIGPSVAIISMSHIIDSNTFEAISKPILIEDYAWLGMRAMLMPGVILEKGAVVGAGSIVTKKVAAFNIVAGSPATKVREQLRNSQLEYELNYFPYFNSDIY